MATWKEKNRKLLHSCECHQFGVVNLRFQSRDEVIQCRRCQGWLTEEEVDAYIRGRLTAGILTDDVCENFHEVMEWVLKTKMDAQSGKKKQLEE